MKRHLLLAGILAICVTLLVPAAALAGTGAGDTDVTATLVTSYTLVPPDAINLGDTIDTAGMIDMGPYSITVSTNDAAATTCGITVADKAAGTKGANAGKLSDGAATPHYLGTALMVSGGSLPGNALLTATPKELRPTNTPKGSASISNFGIHQDIGANDFSNPGTYTITLVFTATFN